MTNDRPGAGSGRQDGLGWAVSCPRGRDAAAYGSADPYRAQQIWTPGRMGRPVGSIKGAWKRAVSELGIKDATPNVLRHTAATWIAQDGVTLWEIAKRIGHKDTRMAERIYAHWRPDDQPKSTEALARRMADITPKSRNGRQK